MKEITIEYLVGLLLRRLVVMIVVAALFATAAFGYCRFLADPVYRATSQIVVSNGAVIIEDNLGEDDSKISGSDIQSSMYLANVCVGLLKTQDFHKKLSEKLEGKYSYSRLAGMVSVGLNGEEDLFINISVNHTDPEEAKKVSNTMVAMAPDYIKDFMPSAKIMITATADSASKVSPRTAMVTALFFVVGAAFVYIIALIVSLNDKTIKGVSDFTATYHIPVLGGVPDFENASTQGGYSYAENK